MGTSGTAPPAPPSSPGVFASVSACWLARYLRYSAPTAKLTGFLAQSCSGVSPLIVPRPCDSTERVLVVDCWLMKAAICGVIEPSGPKMFSGTQPDALDAPVGRAVVKQVVALVAHSDCRTREVRT